MKIRTKMSALAIVLLSMLMMVPSAFAAPSIPASTTFPGYVGGRAYAGYFKLPAGDLLDVAIGPLFSVAKSCGVAAATLTATSASLSALNPIAGAGTTTDTLTTTRTTSGASVTSSSQIAGINLLGGLITADSIHSVATTTATISGGTSTAGATFVNLKVGGEDVTATPAKNSKITLPGIGKVILNEVTGPTNGPTASSATVIAIDVQVSLTNTFLLPIGAKLILGYANSNYTATSAPATVSSQSYGLEATGLSGGLTSGPYASAGVSCAGGSDSASVASESLGTAGSILTLGTLTDTAAGSLGASNSTSTATSTVQDINLLGGVVTATAVTSTATVGSGTPTATGSSTFTSLHVLGIPILVNPAPNTTMTLPGIGKVILNEQSLHPSTTAGTATVKAIDIQITVPTNLLGLPVGAHIIVAYAHASVNVF